LSSGSAVRGDNRPVGGTPLVRLKHLSPSPSVEIWAKLEWLNPTGSIKDRVAEAMVAEAKSDGLLGPGTRLVEPSSGNTGIALARVARRDGFHLTVLVPDNVSTERLDLLRAGGAEVVLTPGGEGTNGSISRATDLAAQGRHLMLFQYGNPANPRAHELGTGPEILAALDRVDAFVAGLGSGGTLMGVGKALRQTHPSVQIVAAEPPVGESVAGLRSLEDGYIPPVFDPTAIDAKILVRTEHAVAMTRRLLAEEGLFAGVSSGAAAHAAVRWAQRLDEGVVVTVFPDSGVKYLSSRLWWGTLEEAVARLGTQLYF
jgi:cysteine synthase B